MEAFDSKFTVSTKHWHTLENGRAQCNICPRECKLSEGQRGFCFVRANQAGKIVLTTWGRSSGFCVDPIEKKPLNHFFPGTPVFSFGTAGCNLGCQFCQNWDISKSREQHTLTDQATPEAIAKAALEAGCRSVAFTYNDPVIFHEYAIDVAKACRDLGLKTVAVTAGYQNSTARAEFFKYMDAANVDLKGFTDEFYKRVCMAKLEPVLETLKYIKHETGVWLEITTLLIPTKNDSEDEIMRMCEWVVRELGPDVPLHFSAFHPDFKMTDLPSTPPEVLSRARAIAMSAGVQYAYTGNVHDADGDTTRCHHCNEILIERDWYELRQYNMSADTCPKCQAKIPGMFDAEAGDWGRKRLPVRLRTP